MVVIARRRLTPSEVESFSAAFHASFGAGASVAGAVRDGRLALHEASRRPKADMARIGKDAWASFILHGTEGGADPGALGTVAARVAEDSEPLPLLPPPLARPIAGLRLALIQVANEADCRHWQARFARWLPVLAEDVCLEEASTDDVLPPYLEPPSPVTDARSRLRIRSRSDPTGAALDVVFVRCDPAQLLRGSDAGGAGELYPLVEPWPPPESETSASPALRWLAGHPLSDEEVCSAELLAPKFEECADPEWEELLERTIAAANVPSEDLWAGLTSCSEGLLRVEGTIPDEDTAIFEALSAFLDRAHSAGLARRLQRGRFALDRLHPRLCAVIRHRLLATADPSPSPWLDWTFRVAVCAPQLRYREAELLPYYETLADRLRRPDEVLGPQVAEVSSRNYVFHGLAQLAAGSTPDEVWTKLWEKEAEEMPAGLDRLLEAIESKRRSGLDPADAFIDLKTTTRPHLASLLLSNGPLPGMSVFQSDAQVHATITAVLITGAEDIQAQIQTLAGMYAWPEDRGHVWSAAATALIELGRDREGLPMLANALAEQLVCEGPHATSHCVEALTTRAAIARKAGLRDRWHRDAELARRLIRSSNWLAFTSMVSDFLDELWTAGDREAYRMLIAFLWRTAPEKSRSAAWLARKRVHALRDVGRDREAEEVIAGVDREPLSDRTRSILDSLMISCLLERQAFAEATRLAEEIETYATDTVLAEVRLLHARALKGDDGSRTRRIELLRLGSEVPEGDWAAANCRATLCHELLDAGDYAACATEAAALRRSEGFPLAVKAAALEAAALAMSDTDRERAIAAAKVACWHRDVHIFILLRMAFKHAGWTEDLEQVVQEVSVAQNEWVLEGSPPPPTEISVDPATVARWQLEQIRASPAAELSNLDESRVHELRESVLTAWAAWEHLGHALWDQGRLDEALVYFEMGIHELELYPHVAQDERIRLSAISAHYSKASVTRSLGQTDSAIELGTRICSRVVSELREGTVSEESKPELIDQLSLVLEMIGNCQFDKGNYRASLALHGRAVRAAIRSEGPVDADAVLAAVRANPVASWRVVHCLGNWGNSLAKLGLEEQYRSARAVAVLLAERLDNLDESVQNNPTHKYILSLIEGSFSQHVPTDNPLGLALARVRTALASA